MAKRDEFYNNLERTKHSVTDSIERQTSLSNTSSSIDVTLSNIENGYDNVLLHKENITVPKKKTGRKPKYTTEMENIHIKIPKTTKEKLDRYLIRKRISLTDYLNDLISYEMEKEN